MRQRVTVFAFFLLVAIGAVGQLAEAANLTVNCNKKNHTWKSDTSCSGPHSRAKYGNCCGQLHGEYFDSKRGSTDTDC
jgi:hypothetical protein